MKSGVDMQNANTNTSLRLRMKDIRVGYPVKSSVVDPEKSKKENIRDGFSPRFLYRIRISADEEFLLVPIFKANRIFKNVPRLFYEMTIIYHLLDKLEADKNRIK